MQINILHRKKLNRDPTTVERAFLKTLEGQKRMLSFFFPSQIFHSDSFIIGRSMVLLFQKLLTFPDCVCLRCTFYEIKTYLQKSGLFAQLCLQRNFVKSSLKKKSSKDNLYSSRSLRYESSFQEWNDEIGFDARFSDSRIARA